MPSRFVIATAAVVFAVGLVTAQNAEASKKPKRLDSTVQQDDANPITILSCHFESEGKAGDICEATLSLVAVPKSTNVGSPPNQFIVRCNGDDVYDGGAFFNSVALSPEFASSVIAANTNITASYPAVWVDGDVNGESFTDRFAHLRLDGDSFVPGRCDHTEIVR